MRTIKPEFWSKRSLAGASRDARLLYIALWNFADEHGRCYGDVRWIKGHAFPYDDDLTLLDVDRLLGELVGLGRVVRYDAADDLYLYLPKLSGHQRLEPAKSASRLPPPPQMSESVRPEPPDTPPTAPQNGLSPAETPLQQDHVGEEADPAQIFPANLRLARATPGTSSSSMLQVAGCRLQVSASRGDATASPPAADPPPTVDKIVGGWLENCRKRPPANVIAHTGKTIKTLLSEGIDPDDVARGVTLWAEKGLHPSALPSVVNQIMNSSPQAAAPATTDQRVAQALAAGERLMRKELA